MNRSTALTVALLVLAVVATTVQVQACTSSSGDGTLMGTNYYSCGAGECQNSIIEGCDFVLCAGDGACESAEIIGDGNTDVGCDNFHSNDRSCQYATFRNINRMKCVGKRSFRASYIYDSTTIECSGIHSCELALINGNVAGSTLECTGKRSCDNCVEMKIAGNIKCSNTFIDLVSKR